MRIGLGKVLLKGTRLCLISISWSCLKICNSYRTTVFFIVLNEFLHLNQQPKCADPNILLLDEPTNHLDLESVEWLEAFLRNQNIPMVIVSHDREFLDQVCTKIVDAEGGVCTEYQGNYSRFLQLKKGASVNTALCHIVESIVFMFCIMFLTT